MSIGNNNFYDLYMKEHNDCRRSDAVYYALKINPAASTEEVIGEARKIAAFIMDAPLGEVVSLVDAAKEKK